MRWRLTKVVFPTPPSPTRMRLNSGVDAPPAAAGAGAAGAACACAGAENENPPPAAGAAPKLKDAMLVFVWGRERLAGRGILPFKKRGERGEGGSALHYTTR